jgi:hypothetical protein
MRAYEIVAPTITLDRVSTIRRVDPDVLKIDVEGAELLVLRGARELLTRKSVAILCELHPLQMQNCRSSVDELQAYLDEIGYVMEPLDAPGPQDIFHARISSRVRIA